MDDIEKDVRALYDVGDPSVIITYVQKILQGEQGTEANKSEKADIQKPKSFLQEARETLQSMLEGGTEIKEIIDFFVEQVRASYYNGDQAGWQRGFDEGMAEQKAQQQNRGFKPYYGRKQNYQRTYNNNSRWRKK